MPKVGGPEHTRHLTLGDTASRRAAIRPDVKEFVDKVTESKPLKAAIFPGGERVEFSGVDGTTSLEIARASRKNDTKRLKTLLKNATATVVREAVEEILITRRLDGVRPFPQFQRTARNNTIMKLAGFWLDPPGKPPGQESSSNGDAVSADSLLTHLANEIKSTVLLLDTGKGKRDLLPRESRLIENGAALARAWGYGPGGAHPEGGFEHRTHEPGILKASQAITDPLFRNLERLTEGKGYTSIHPSDRELLVKRAQEYLNYHKGRSVPREARELWKAFLKKDTNTIQRIKDIANYTPPDGGMVSEACLVLVYAARIFLLSAAGQTGRALVFANRAVRQLDPAGGGAAPMEEWADAKHAVGQLDAAGGGAAPMAE